MIERFIVDEALAVSGVRLGTASSGTRYQERDDVVVMELPPGASFACLFTGNRFCAAPVTVAREFLSKAQPAYLIINAGNANAGTGALGESAAREVCQAVASRAQCALESVIPFSTGVIGEPLPVAGLSSAFEAAFDALAEDGWSAAASAILTTDTRPKLCTAEFISRGQVYRMTGICKGSGMIKPNMATMLAFVATDAPISDDRLPQLVQDVANRSFNRITVDGDTSTNDAFAFAARPHCDAMPDFDDVQQALVEVCEHLAREIVRDGEGATREISIHVSGGRYEEDCLKVAYAVAESPLVKTAFFAGDPNWGRILAAVGRAGVEDLDIASVQIAVGELALIIDGEPNPAYQEAVAAEIFSAAAVSLDIVIGTGRTETTVWTCDLSYDYVKINGEYRT